MAIHASRLTGKRPFGRWRFWAPVSVVTVASLIVAAVVVGHSPPNTPQAAAVPSSTTTATAAPTTAAPTPTPTTPATRAAGPGQWVSVDPAQQARDTAAFFATTPKPITGNPTRVSEFHASCTVSHHGSDDPIVFPGIAGVSHNHAFIGNRTTDADSTARSLFAGATTCTPGQDHSAYWIPTLYQHGRVVDPSGVTVYYGSRLKDPSRTQPFPFGLRMIAGDPRTQTDDAHHGGNHFWCAGIGGAVGRTADGVFPVCAKTANLNRQIVFPDCWDGKHLDSPDHKSHLHDAVGGACPAAFPVPIPNVSFVLSYPISTDTSGITLSSGTSFSMHADFFNAWQPEALAVRVRNCVDQHVKCDAAGNFEGG